MEPYYARGGLVGSSLTSGSGWRTRLSDLFDRVVLALAVAGTSENGEALDAEYAEAMVLVFDEYFRMRTQAHPRPAAAGGRNRTARPGTVDPGGCCP